MSTLFTRTSHIDSSIERDRGGGRERGGKKKKKKKPEEKAMTDVDVSAPT